MRRLRNVIERLLGAAAIGLAVGAAAGATGFYLARLDGIWAVVAPASLVGACAGIAIAWAAAPVKLWRRLELSEVAIKVPGVGDFKFALDNAQQGVAWKLFVELMSRIATQPLAGDSGSVSEALASFYTLFATCREILKGMHPSQPKEGTHRVEELALRMLNREIRPFLTHWHCEAMLVEDAKDGQPHLPADREEELREQLGKLRLRILEYARSFGQLAQVGRLEDFFDTPPEAPDA